LAAGPNLGVDLAIRGAAAISKTRSIASSSWSDPDKSILAVE
jgi:hypothetical protein